MSLWQFLKDFVEEFVGVDSKLVRTLVPLLIRPGFLTKEWSRGRRARYISPLKLYLTLSALCFLVLALLPQSRMISTTSDKPAVVMVEDGDKPSAQHDNSFEGVMKRELGKLGGTGPMADARRTAFYNNFKERLPQANFLLLPIFALFFKLLYARRSRYYVEHLVFALHFYAFTFTAFTVVTLIPWSFVSFPIVMYGLAYLPIAMFVNYGQGIIKTGIKCVLFGMGYLTVAGFVALGVVLLAAHEIPVIPAAPLPASAPGKSPTKPAPQPPTKNNGPLTPSSPDS